MDITPAEQEVLDQLLSSSLPNEEEQAEAAKAKPAAEANAKSAAEQAVADSEAAEANAEVDVGMLYFSLIFRYKC